MSITKSSFLSMISNRSNIRYENFIRGILENLEISREKFEDLLEIYTLIETIRLSNIKGEIHLNLDEEITESMNRVKYILNTIEKYFAKPESEECKGKDIEQCSEDKSIKERKERCFKPKEDLDEEINIAGYDLRLIKMFFHSKNLTDWKSRLQYLWGTTKYLVENGYCKTKKELVKALSEDKIYSRKTISYYLPKMNVIYDCVKKYNSDELPEEFKIKISRYSKNHKCL